MLCKRQMPSSVGKMSVNSSLEQESQIISQLPSAFQKAVESGQLFFFSSTLNEHVESEIEFQLRLCPALQKKPTAITQPKDAEKPKDPFAPPYVAELYVGDLRPEDDEEYAILLNKFSVVERHFLLVTKEYRSQTSPLSPSDLLQSYQLLLAARQIGQTYIAFYNCGDVSGASQTHKHIQFLPVKSLPIEKLANLVNGIEPGAPFVISQLPYAHGIIRFPFSLSSLPKENIKYTLVDGFLRLLDFAIMTTRHNEDQQPGPPSYNVIMTTEHLHLIPRSKEVYTLKSGDPISVNSLGFSGMMLVKSEEELEAVKGEGVLKILEAVGMKKFNEEHD